MTPTTLTMNCFRSAPSSNSVGARIRDQISADHPLLYGPRLSDAAADLKRAQHLVDRIDALSEPWRSRFVDLITERMGVTLPGGVRPKRCQLAEWLSDQQLSQMIRMMLRTWTHQAD